ncbi:MAG: L-histidine N(alpha)-methyltransferase [Gammaproteobacteria bacterium]|nr:L-histidine N(alpha)-methyltransferase [Gammaproteobacteria bacterium]|tara:strand:- start:6728 stop:7678 length:951 start_codon:yes stop_codon:yes gene_type:complete
MAGDFEFFDAELTQETAETQVVAGLSASPKTIAPKFFYNETGSKLFEDITRLPEYYPTRTEVSVLRSHGREMAERIGPGSALIEFGAGNSEKIRVLLDALRPSVYAPLDISRDFLRDSAAALAADHPGLRVKACVVDYTREVDLPFETDGRRVAFFPGSSIGNFSPADSARFLRRSRELVGDQGALLLGVDLKKDVDVLHAAYNDSAGVTAAFNLNVLTHLNALVGTDFDAASFRHVAFYNEAEDRIEMHLESTSSQTVTLGEWSVDIGEGERIHTENSHKFDHAQVVREAALAGFSKHVSWEDPNGWFGVYLLHN